MAAITDFMDTHFRHFNARIARDAARGWKALLAKGGEMFLAMAGAMSTAELGISLARMIREGKISAVCCTAANLEEDVFALFAHDEYQDIANWRNLNRKDEKALFRAGLNRVTDTCIPETVMRHTEDILVELWQEAARTGRAKFPYEFIYDLLARPELSGRYRGRAAHSWVIAAREKNIPVFTPGWEDSSLGNIFTAKVMDGTIASHRAIRPGTEQMQRLAHWYEQRSKAGTPVGFFQIGGGIAGDFPICVVPMLIQDLQRQDTRFWSYFAQISDSTTSYGSYSGAIPAEKITWGKLDEQTPTFVIESDATIVAPLIFAYVLGE